MPGDEEPSSWQTLSVSLGAWGASILRGAAFALLLGVACARPPVPATPDGALDRQLRELVELRLSTDRRTCPFAIQVVVYNGTVELAGLVDGPVEQKRAEEIARAAGALRVVDRLELSLSSGDGGRC